jgi:hypothetical protein
VSLHEYEYAQGLYQLDPPFHALLMAAMKKADADNLRKLRETWPGVYAEMKERDQQPGGKLEIERQIEVATPARRENDRGWFRQRK